MECFPLRESWRNKLKSLEEAFTLLQVESPLIHRPVLFPFGAGAERSLLLLRLHPL